METKFFFILRYYNESNGHQHEMDYYFTNYRSAFEFAEIMATIVNNHSFYIEGQVAKDRHAFSAEYYEHLHITSERKLESFSVVNLGMPQVAFED